MKKHFIVFIVLGLLSAGPAFAIPFGFTNIANNNPEDAAIGEAQLSVDVTDEPTGLNGTVGFIFQNSGPAPSSITQIYFDNAGGILNDFQTSLDPFFDKSSEVDFHVGATPIDLPGGQTVGFVTNFSAGADSPAPDNGVNPGGFLGILFNLIPGGDYDDVIASINSGALRIGIHVQGFASKGSESFVNNPVPEPATMLLLGTGLASLAGFGRKKFFKK